MFIALIIAAVTLGVLIGWLIDRHHTNHTDTGLKTDGVSKKGEGK